MKITAKTNNATLTGSETSYVLDFGTIKKNSKAKTTVTVEGENLQILTSNTSCGCTRAETNKIDSTKTEVDITYKNTHNVSPFSKEVYLNVTETSSNNRVVIQVKGNVIN